VPFSVQIVASAQEELKEIDVFYRLQIAAAIESNLVHQPTLESRNRKMLAEAADFWRMIRERRQEQAIGWEEAKKGLQLD
jgi:hypothetical protein